MDMSWRDGDVTRLAQRLRRYRETLSYLAGLSQGASDNNHAEREIHLAVIRRKNCQGKRRGNRAKAQAIIMSVYRTLKLRGLDSLDTIVATSRTHVVTDTLPPLPEGKPAVGCSVTN